MQSNLKKSISTNNKNKVITMKELRIRLSIMVGVLILLLIPNLANANKNSIEESTNYESLTVEEGREF